MKQLLIIVFFFLTVVGCDQVEDGIIDPKSDSFIVEVLTAPSEVEYSGGNTIVNTSLSFSSSEDLERVWLNVNSVDGTIEIARNLEMTSPDKNNPRTFSASFNMIEENPSIMYTIEYFISTTVQAEIKIASHNFEYNNLQDNFAPVISNPLFYYDDEEPMLRDILENNKPFIFSIDVSDENGLSDIDSVYTDFYSPNNPSAVRVLMYDDGNEEHGDLIAGDGIFSFKNIFLNADGERKFEFWARDRAGALSNMITHNVVVR